VAYWFKVQREVWHDQVDFGRHNLQEFLRFVTDPLASPNRVLFGLSIILTAALVTVLVRAKLAVELNIFAVGIVLLALISQVLYPNPRFLLTAFPLTIALASSLRTNPYRLVLVASAAVMPLLLLFYAIGHLEQGNFPVQYFVAP
jgi:heme/copper-type cytochrome/quinol oxidase subunit 4